MTVGVCLCICDCGCIVTVCIAYACMRTLCDCGCYCKEEAAPTVSVRKWLSNLANLQYTLMFDTSPCYNIVGTEKNGPCREWCILYLLRGFKLCI